MVTHKLPGFIFSCIAVCILLCSCNGNAAKQDKKIVINPEKMDEQSGETIKQVIEFAMQHNAKIDDSTKLQMQSIVNNFYIQNEYVNVWSKKEKWVSLADSLFQFIHDAELFGLFPQDYQARKLLSLKQKMDKDSMQRMDAVNWAKADLLLTDACLHILKDLKYGRLTADNISLLKDTGVIAKFVIANLKMMLSQKQFYASVAVAEPSKKGYQDLKMGIKHFVDSMDRSIYTYLTYPYKKNDAADSLLFIKNLKKRLAESKCADTITKLPDSLQLNAAVKKYQKLKGIKQDGIISKTLIKMMNTSDVERFKRIAITLDRYKILPDSMPAKYIWVNLPGYYLQLWDSDTIALVSKIICGKPETRTPLLTSAITDMVLYPTWTVPTSIIAKQYLPKLKNNPNYLSRIGLKLMNEKGQAINPGDINWAKYSKGIPYKIMQKSGDDNALGVMKFNFDNPFAVYLHDTNQRYLFKNTSRALSHGCVRVQEWDKLADYIARNDSMNLKIGDTLRYTTDSIHNWLAEKKHKRIVVKNELPLFITYFSCEGKDGKIKFYEDIYGEDKVLREKYFSDK